MSIVLENITHMYMAGTPYERTAVKNINLTIEKGQFIGIIGQTGSGKSTLIQHMNGLLKPATGRVLIDNVDINSKTTLAKNAAHKVGMAFQYPEHQIFEETIYADIAFGPRNLKLTEAEIEDRVRQAMQFTGLDFAELATRSPFQLSGGQLRRVAIAGVIALQPEYLILDEPSAGLDPKGREEIFDQIIRLYKTTGITVILVSHNMDEVASLANRVIVLKNGEILRDGTPAEVFCNRPEELLKAGLGIPAITALLTKLKENGIAISTTVFTIEDAINEIIIALKGK